MSLIFNVSESTIFRSVKELIPIMLVALNFTIGFPSDELSAHPFEGIMGAIDCTAHPRTRVHPRQADYYRDRGFCLTAQIIVPLTGNRI